MASSGSNDATNGNGSTSQATTIEDLYKYFGILADAKQDAGKVKFISILFLYNVICK
jgi:hypothetical protein